MPVPLVVHTKDQLLHPAARLDFDRHVQSLVDEGKVNEARRLWRSVVEVVHLPPPEEPILQPNEFGPLALAACTAPGCQRCQTGHGGYQFPWIGPWSREGVLVRVGDNTTVAGSWISSSFSGIRVGSAWRTWCRPIGQQRCRDVRGIQDVPLCPSCSAGGVTGRWGQLHGLTRLLPLCHPHNKDR